MTDPVWTFPGPILDILAEGIGRGGVEARVYTMWKRGREPYTYEVELLTDSGWVTIRRLEGT